MRLQREMREAKKEAAMKTANIKKKVKKTVIKPKKKAG